MAKDDAARAAELAAAQAEAAAKREEQGEAAPGADRSGPERAADAGAQHHKAPAPPPRTMFRRKAI